MTTFTSWDTELYHFGIKGQKWGRRRWQNEDGSLTEAGRRRYGTIENYERLTNRKRIKYMTNEELARNTQRLEAENRYKALQRENSGIDKLTNLVKEIAKKKSDQNRSKLEELKQKTQQIVARNATAKAFFDVRKTVQEHKQARIDNRQKLRQALSKGLKDLMNKEGVQSKDQAKVIADLKGDVAIATLNKKLKELTIDMEEVDSKKAAAAKEKRQRSHSS